MLSPVTGAGGGDTAGWRAGAPAPRLPLLRPPRLPQVGLQSLVCIKTCWPSPFLLHSHPTHDSSTCLASYVKLQMTASLASSATGVLSTQALLYAMGLGAGAIPLAAALNWVIKDGVGQIGGIVFARCVCV